jgi:cell wall-associated protease
MKNLFNVLAIFFIFGSFSFGQTQVPNDWYYGSPGEGYNGIAMRQAYNDVLKGKNTQTVVVAVIDSGIDVEHEDLKDNIWVNPGEIEGNGIDDDKNGYIDDIHGWNFIGGPGGKNVGPDSYEATRVYGSLKYKYESVTDVKKLTKAQKVEYETYTKARDIVVKEIEKATAAIDRIKTRSKSIIGGLNTVATSLGGKALTSSFVDSFQTKDNAEVTTIKNILKEYVVNRGVTNINEITSSVKEQIEADMKGNQDKLDYAYNANFDPRKTIVMDNYADPNEKYYGNNDYEGPDALHGTHVAGIIGAVRDNKIGMDGVAANVRIMSVRAVPDGDERDKDVANAIRYAVDNGAKVINMSFGKGFGTHKTLVDEAVKYAAKKDVLLVHAAGNSAQNNDDMAAFPNYPNANFEKKSGFLFKKKKRAANWIEVGALNHKQGEDTPAPFSNYGAKEVDLFAPGMRIYSTLPDNEYAPLQGTSMASPVVAGVAATIRSLYPGLTAVQVKQAITSSVTPLNVEVKLPGGKAQNVAFSKLSVTGGTVNLNNALKAASVMKGAKPVQDRP